MTARRQAFLTKERCPASFQLVRNRLHCSLTQQRTKTVLTAMQRSLTDKPDGAGFIALRLRLLQPVCQIEHPVGHKADSIRF
ncbi:hypothetical protein D3C85_1820330 [compost metagenome]